MPAGPPPTTQSAAVGDDELDEMKLMVVFTQLREIIEFGDAVVSKDEPRFRVGDTEADSRRPGLKSAAVGVTVVRMAVGCGDGATITAAVRTCGAGACFATAAGRAGTTALPGEALFALCGLRQPRHLHSKHPCQRNERQIFILRRASGRRTTS